MHGARQEQQAGKDGWSATGEGEQAGDRDLKDSQELAIQGQGKSFRRFLLNMVGKY